MSFHRIQEEDSMAMYFNRLDTDSSLFCSEQLILQHRLSPKQPEPQLSLTSPKRKSATHRSPQKSLNSRSVTSSPEQFSLQSPPKNEDASYVPSDSPSPPREANGHTTISILKPEPEHATTLSYASTFQPPPPTVHAPKKTSDIAAIGSQHFRMINQETAFEHSDSSADRVLPRKRLHNHRIHRDKSKSNAKQSVSIANATHKSHLEVDSLSENKETDFMETLRRQLAHISSDDNSQHINRNNSTVNGSHNNANSTVLSDRQYSPTSPHQNHSHFQQHASHSAHSNQNSPISPQSHSNLKPSKVSFRTMKANRNHQHRLPRSPRSSTESLLEPIETLDQTSNYGNNTLNNMFSVTADRVIPKIKSTNSSYGDDICYQNTTTTYRNHYNHPNRNLISQRGRNTGNEVIEDVLKSLLSENSVNHLVVTMPPLSNVGQPNDEDIRAQGILDAEDGDCAPNDLIKENDTNKTSKANVHSNYSNNSSDYDNNNSSNINNHDCIVVDENESDIVIYNKRVSNNNTVDKFDETKGIAHDTALQLLADLVRNEQAAYPTIYYSAGTESMFVHVSNITQQIMSLHDNGNTQDNNNYSNNNNNSNSVNDNSKSNNNTNKIEINFDNSIGDLIVVPNDAIAFRYELIQEIANTSKCMVCEAFDHKMKMPTALKIYKSVGNFNESCNNEVSLLKRLRQTTSTKSHCTAFFEDFSFRSHRCLTFPLYGPSLRENIRARGSRGFPLQLVQIISRQIMDALTYLHSEGIVHNCITPENIVFKDHMSAEIVLVGFSNSFTVNIRSSTGSGASSNVHLIPTCYQSPEVILSIPSLVGTKSDLFSAATVLFELRMSRPLFAVHNLGQHVRELVRVLGEPQPGVVAKSPYYHKFFVDHPAPTNTMSTHNHHSNHNSNNNSSHVIATQPTQHAPHKIHLKSTTHLTHSEALNTFRESLGLTNADNDFMSFLIGCLRWDPNSRSSSEASRTHPFLCKTM